MKNEMQTVAVDKKRCIKQRKQFADYNSFKTQKIFEPGMI